MTMETPIWFQDLVIQLLSPNYGSWQFALKNRHQMLVIFTGGFKPNKIRNHQWGPSSCFEGEKRHRMSNSTIESVRW